MPRILNQRSIPLTCHDEPAQPEFVERAARQGVDFEKVRRVLSMQAGGLPASEVVLRGIIQVIARAKPSPKADRTGLILKSIKTDWAEWERVLSEAAA